MAQRGRGRKAAKAVEGEKKTRHTNASLVTEFLKDVNEEELRALVEPLCQKYDRVIPDDLTEFKKLLTTSDGFLSEVKSALMLTLHPEEYRLQQQEATKKECIKEIATTASSWSRIGKLQGKTSTVEEYVFEAIECAKKLFGIDFSNLQEEILSATRKKLEPKGDKKNEVNDNGSRKRSRGGSDVSEGHEDEEHEQDNNEDELEDGEPDEEVEA